MIKIGLLDKKRVELVKNIFSSEIGEKGFPTLLYSITWAAELLQLKWKANVESADTKTGWKLPYKNSIKIKKGNNYSMEVFAEKNKYVNFIENGIKSYDMKKGFMNSSKVKKFKNGTKYLTIFMQKRKREIQSQDVKKQLKDINHYRPAGTAENGLKKIYSQSQSAQAGASIEDRMTKVGSKKHSGFGTFRIVTENSKGWIYPNIPGVKVFKKTIGENFEFINQKIEMALNKDLDMLQEIINGK